MNTLIAERVSPLLDVKGETIDLPYAPLPWVLKQCTQTGMIFLANPPSYEALSEEFAYEVTFKKESKARRQAEPLRYAFSSALKRLRGQVFKRNKTLRLVRELVRTSNSKLITVLDLGCGWGELLDRLMRSLPSDLATRCLPHGVEISRELARLSDIRLRLHGGRCVHASAQEGIQQFDHRYFDVIVMASYLEHEVNPLPVLQGCRERLKPEGSLFIKVPNYACLNRRLRGAKWCGFRWPDHVNYFTPHTLRAMLDKAGLEIVSMTALDQSILSDNMYAIARLKAGYSTFNC